MATLKSYLMAEATEYEVKEELEIKAPKSWLKTISAFLNGVGGTIYFGVSDDMKAAGLSDMHTKITQIAQLIKERIDPAAICEFEPVAADGKELLKLKVPAGVNTPYAYVGDGNRIVYYRLGNESIPAPQQIIFELTLKGKRQTYDTLDSGLSFDNYSFTLLDATFKERTGAAIDKAKDYISFGMVTPKNTLTYAGALFADQYAVKNSRIFCTHWNGVTKTSKFEADDDAEFEGNIIKLLGEALSFIRANSAVKWFKTGSGHEELPDYPQDSVYEALVNALVHREYTNPGTEIHIDMYDDRLEIVSPGAMMDGKRIQDMPIESVASGRRNPLICDIMHRLKFMQRRGSGLKKIVEAYPNGIVPEFATTPQSFIVKLKNLNFNKAVASTENVGVNVGVNKERRGYAMTFGEKLKSVRYKLFLSQQDIAKELGVSFSSVNRWERGHYNPNFKALAAFDKLCKKNKITFEREDK